MTLPSQQKAAREAFHDFPKSWVNTGEVLLKNADVYPFLDEQIAQAFHAGQMEERWEIYDLVSGKHVVARKNYTSDSWDAGYHDALFAVERAISSREDSKGV